MKRKWLKALMLSACLCATAAFGVACGGSGADGKCDHVFTNYVSNGDATCAEDGTKTATCDNGCGAEDTVTDEGTATGCSFTDYKSNNDATCAADGTKTAVCDNGCGAKDTVTDEGTATGCSFTDYKSNGDATCAADGTKTAVCDNGCGAKDTITDEGTKLEHNYVDGVCSDCDDIKESEGLRFTENSDWKSYSVTGIGTCQNTKIKIPAEYRGRPVTGIGDAAFSDRHNLTKIVIPDSVTSIGSSAFYNCMNLKEIVIPDSVTSIGSSAFYNCSSLKEIIIPDGVTSIGSSAFYNCSNLTKIVIPDSVTSIGDYAFYYCDHLLEIVMPNSLTSIGVRAFDVCSSLKKIVIPASVTSIGNSAFYECRSLKSVYITDIEAWLNISFGNSDSNPLFYAENLYLDNDLVTELVIPNTVTEINAAFSGCDSLKRVEIPDSVTSIGISAFYGCSGLTEIVIPESVTSIGNSAFYGCSNLTEIVIPASVTSIGNSVFSGCALLTLYCEAISKPAGWATSWNNDRPIVWNCNNNDVASDGYMYTYIDGLRYKISRAGVVDVAEQSKEISTANILSKITYKDKSYPVTGIGSSAFYNCMNLTEIVIPNSITNIGGSAFSGCKNLTKIVIPESVTSIYGSAFKGCSSLTEIIIPDNVTSIGEYTFQGCVNLKEIVIPNGVTSIGRSVFSGCTNLTNITIGSGVQKIIISAFDRCDSLVNITVNEANTAYKDVDGDLYSKDGKTLVLYAGGKTQLSFTIPDNVTSVGDYAFSGCSSLTEIVIPNSVTSIGSYAFSGCSNLKEIVIPNSVTSIGSYAFNTCDSLAKIVIPISVIEIREGVFNGCQGLVIYCEAVSQPSGWYHSWNDNPAVWDCKNNDVAEGGYVYTMVDGLTYALKDDVAIVAQQTKNIKVANILSEITYKGKNYPVTGIGDYAFQACNKLTEVVIPNSITSIGAGAFQSCNSLMEIIIPDSVMNMYAQVFANCYFLTIYCEAASIPELGRWEYNWNYSSCPVVWDCKNNDVAGDGYIYTVVDGLRYALKDDVATVVEQSDRASNAETINILAEITYKGKKYVVKNIAYAAFANFTNVTEIVIPDGVSDIDDWAFQNCTSLTKITFNGTIAQWEKVAKGTGWNSSVPATKVVCKDGEVTL